MRQTSIFISLILFVLSGTTQAAPDLDSFIKKYQHVKISPSIYQQLSRHEKLIEHFSSLHYLKPGSRVDADFIRALIVAESSANTRAQSTKDARGLTQIIYSTGLQAARELAKTRYPFHYVSQEELTNLKPHDLYKPAINLLLACYLIAKYNLQFNGRLDLVVAAWNAGEKTIKNNSPPPYKETLNLIGKVNGYFLYLLKKNNRISFQE
jgi:soluble lytic murein transglycosylase-like protein